MDRTGQPLVDQVLGVDRSSGEKSWVLGPSNTRAQDAAAAELLCHRVGHVGHARDATQKRAEAKSSLRLVRRRSLRRASRSVFPEYRPFSAGGYLEIASTEDTDGRLSSCG